MKYVTINPELLSMTANSTFQSETSFTIENITSEEIKFKVRFSNDTNFSSKPIIGNIPAKSTDTVKVSYFPKEKIKMMDLCKFQLHVIKLSGLKDNGPSTFTDAPEKVEKEHFPSLFRLLRWMMPFSVLQNQLLKLVFLMMVPFSGHLL